MLYDIEVATVTNYHSSVQGSPTTIPHSRPSSKAKSLAQNTSSKPRIHHGEAAKKSTFNIGPASLPGDLWPSQQNHPTSHSRITSNVNISSCGGKNTSSCPTIASKQSLEPASRAFTTYASTNVRVASAVSTSTQRAKSTSSWSFDM